MMKIKVKTPSASSSMYPTELHLRGADGLHRKNEATVHDLTKGALVAPIVSMTYGIYISGGGAKFGISIYADEIIVCPVEKTADDLSYFPSSVPLSMAENAVVVSPKVTMDAGTTSARKNARERTKSKLATVMGSALASTPPPMWKSLSSDDG